MRVCGNLNPRIYGTNPNQTTNRTWILVSCRHHCENLDLGLMTALADRFFYLKASPIWVIHPSNRILFHPPITTSWVILASPPCGMSISPSNELDCLCYLRRHPSPRSRETGAQSVVSGAEPTQSHSRTVSNQLQRQAENWRNRSNSLSGSPDLSMTPPRCVTQQSSKPEDMTVRLRMDCLRVIHGTRSS